MDWTKAQSIKPTLIGINCHCKPTKITHTIRKLHTLYKSLYNRSIRLLVVLPQRVSWPGFFTLLASIKLYLILSPSTADLRLETSTDESRNGSFKTIIVFAIIHSCELNIASRCVIFNKALQASQGLQPSNWHSENVFGVLFFSVLLFLTTTICYGSSSQEICTQCWKWNGRD